MALNPSPQIPPTVIDGNGHDPYDPEAVRQAISKLAPQDQAAINKALSSAFTTDKVERPKPIGSKLSTEEAKKVKGIADEIDDPDVYDKTLRDQILDTLLGTSEKPKRPAAVESISLALTMMIY